MSQNPNPELDVLFKYATQFINKKVSELLNTAEQFAKDAAPQAPPSAQDHPDVPGEVNVKIESVLRHHASTMTSGGMLRCKCGVTNNELAQRVHVTKEIVKALSAPDPVAKWWSSVTDKP